VEAYCLKQKNYSILSKKKSEQPPAQAGGLKMYRNFNDINMLMDSRPQAMSTT
jgi:hypothetical protein